MDPGVETTVTVTESAPAITLSGDWEPMAMEPVSVTRILDHEVSQRPVMDDWMPTSTATNSTTTVEENSDTAGTPVSGEVEETSRAGDRTSPTSAEEVVTRHSDSPAPPPPPPPPPAHLEEHAYWAEFEEDNSTPDETEWTEINSSVSAHEHSHWEDYIFKSIDDPELRPLEKARLTWKIKGVRGTKTHPNRATIMRSPAAYVGGYWWNIKFFPRGNNSTSLSIYLEFSPTMPEADKVLPDAEFKMVRGEPDAVLDDLTPEVDLKFPHTSDTPACTANYKSQYVAAADAPTHETSAGQKRNCRVSAQIGVMLYNPDEPYTGWVESSCHQFSPHSPDWGWTNFHDSWDQIHRRRRGQRQPLLKNDTLAFDAYIRIFEDPTQSLWWHASDSEPTWDSLALTGFRPLGSSIINRSADVAGLASWLHIAPIAKLIQSVDVLEHLRNSDVRPRPVCEALQKCLWLLRCRSDSLQYVDTGGITSALRHLHESSSDVTELWECVRRSVELELAGTDAARTFARLLDSPTVPDAAVSSGSAVINTLPNEYNSRICVRTDKVDCVQSALDEYLGGNKQRRWALPPILNIELSRHQFDRATKRWRLIYDRVELDESLDLSPHVVDGMDGKYVLYGYIVHRGRRTSNRFFSVLRPGGPGTKWLAFAGESENRVTCLTRKTAFSTYLGLKRGEKPNEKTGHDVPVAVIYVRNDVVTEYLPGPQGPWDVSDALKTYFESGSYPFRGIGDGKPERCDDDVDVQVEVYTLQNYDRLGSLFDTWDLMAHAKATENVMYLTLPSSARLVDLRKKIATWASNPRQQQQWVMPVAHTHIRLWQVGTTTTLHSNTKMAVSLTRIEELDGPLKKFNLSTVRFWMQVVPKSEAKYFAMSDPPQFRVVSGSKGEEMITDRDGSETPEDGANTPESDGGAAGTQAGIIADDSQDSQDSDAEMTDAATPTHSEVSSEDAGSSHAHSATTTTTTTTTTLESASASSTPILVEPEGALPVRHVYYFIQVFHIEKQELCTVGSFFSRSEELINCELRKHLGWPATRNMMVWRPGWTVCSGSDTFEGGVRDGACFVVGDKLTNERRIELTSAGLFTHPDALTQYLHAKSRNHPTKSLTGTKTLEATFTRDYYSGDFLKGTWHGKGTHISTSSGTIYTGDFIFNHRHGQGQMDYPSGDTYSGDWMHDQPHGQGTFVDGKTGNKYVGGYKDGKRHGKGISYWEVADEEMDLCDVCYGEEKDALFYDCGHVCACVGCARQVEVCPICRRSVINVVKIYRI